MEEQTIEQALPEVSADSKRQAQVMYFSGYKIAEISRQLNIPASTIASWKEREKWDDLAPVLALDYEKINLLKSFGPISGLLINYGLMIACLVFIVWWEKRFIQKAKARLATA